MTLPAWRLLQFPVGKMQLFSWVQNWVLVETRKFFWEYGPDETKTTWELATMAVLELRKAMFMAANNRSPTLADTMNDLDVHHNVTDEMMKAAASSYPATNAFRAPPPLAKEECREPCFYYSNIENEQGIEGVFCSGFNDISIFFQMKLYKSATPKEILEWLCKADKRAMALGYKTGSYVVQLFVTGVVEKNIRKYSGQWPANCMVFSNSALQGLFEPFGSGIIGDIVNLHGR